MNKILVNGLGIGKEIGVCDFCSFDYSWLITHPSVLLWIDKIILTPTVWKAIQGQIYPINDKTSKALKLIFDMAEAENLIEIIDPSTLVTKEFSDIIFKLVESDSLKLVEVFPGIVKKGNEGVPGEIIIGESSYCSMYIWSVYTSLFLARHLDANCLLNERALKYLNLKFGLHNLPKNIDKNYIKSFESVFDVVLPNEALLHSYAFIEEKTCTSCINLSSCKDRYLLEIENGVNKIFKWRTYDEILQIKKVTEKIISKRNSSDEYIDPIEIKKEFITTRNEMNKLIRKVFPKIKRWTNLSTIMSVLIAVGGLVTGNNALTIGGSAIAGSTTIVNELIKYLESKYNWVGFTNRTV